jgi:cysteinyl-tRNA synthetase
VRLYNTRTRSVQELQPLRNGEVRIYVCGLTPSAQAHLGHARSFLFFDVLRRYFAHRGYRVKYVQNVTDIDDRSINAAKESGEYYHAIVDRYYAEFKESMRKFGVLEYDAEPYATQYIEPIQGMIRQLVDGGHAYVAQDGIYYRVATFANYGRLANRNIDELEAGARIEVGEHKEDPLDFALWKFAKPGEPRWRLGDGTRVARSRRHRFRHSRRGRRSDLPASRKRDRAERAVDGASADGQLLGARRIAALRQS